MNKRQFFLEGVKLKHYMSRVWLIRVMQMPFFDLPEIKKPFMLNFNKTEGYYTFDDRLEKVMVEDANKEFPLFQLNEKLILEADDLPNLEEKITTTYNNALVNIIIFIWPWTTPLPYINKKFNGKTVNKVIEGLAQDNKVAIDEFTKNFYRAVGHLKVFTQLAVTAATPRSISFDPKIREFVKKKIAENPDKLEDPAFLAELDMEVGKMDREFIAGDPSAKFFLKGKAYDTVRKKQYYLQGGVARLDDPSKMVLMPNSLDEGMTPDNMVAAVNNLRSGSYGRAKDTALGGEAAKSAARVYQNVQVSSNDCGSVVGEPTVIDDYFISRLEGRYVVGDDEPLTPASLAKLKNKLVYIRSPNACNEPGRNYCRRCLGDQIAKAGIGIGALQGQIANVFMSVALAAFHGSSLKTTLLTKPRAFSKIKRIA